MKKSPFAQGKEAWESTLKTSLQNRTTKKTSNIGQKGSVSDRNKASSKKYE